MTTVPLYQVDAFSTEVFAGNPAAVCPLDDWLADEVMQTVAQENNLSETAFFGPDATGAADFQLRWFTPKAEVELCGHATLASAWVLFNELGFAGDRVTFNTLSGALSVARGEDGELVMDFPLVKAMPSPHPNILDQALRGARVLEFMRAKNEMRMAVLGTAAEVRELKPDFHSIYTLGPLGLIVTAPGDEADDVDFVSRFFAPQVGVSEDPVTGSAHCVSAPYWARRLKKDALRARQVSKRGGDVGCRVAGDRVELSGRGVLYMKGEARLP